MFRLAALVVDEDEAARSALREGLGALDAAIAEARSPEDAIAEIRRQVFDFAFIEARQGDQSGLDLMPAIFARQSERVRRREQRHADDRRDDVRVPQGRCRLPSQTPHAHADHAHGSEGESAWPVGHVGPGVSPPRGRPRPLPRLREPRDAFGLRSHQAGWSHGSPYPAAWPSWRGEEDPSACSSFTDRLWAADIIVYSAPNPIEAVEFLRAGLSPQAVLVDAELGNSFALEVERELANHSQSTHVVLCQISVEPSKN